MNIFGRFLTVEPSNSPSPPLPPPKVQRKKDTFLKGPSQNDKIYMSEIPKISKMRELAYCRPRLRVPSFEYQSFPNSGTLSNKTLKLKFNKIMRILEIKSLNHKKGIPNMYHKAPVFKINNN